MDKNNDPSKWLNNFVLNAALLISSDGENSKLISMGSYDGLQGKYEMFGIRTEESEQPAPLAQTSVFKLFVAKLPTGQLGLMKIAASANENHIIENEAKVLKDLQQKAKVLDEVARNNSEIPPFYGAMFPKVLEKFDAGGRTAIFLGYHECIDSYKQLVPVSVLTRDERVDLKSVVWILGKLLKLLYFVHNFGFTIGSINAQNELLETSIHGIFVLDFSKAKKAPIDECFREVTEAVKIAWNAAGGTENSNPIYDPEIMNEADYKTYVAFLKRIKNGDVKNAGEEFDQLYTISDRIWPKVPKTDGDGYKRQFHEFRTYPRQSEY